MKVIAVNGSSRKNGNTAAGLSVVMEALKADGIGTEQIDIGTRALHGCIACGKCWENQDRKCVLNDDPANEWMQAVFDADGIVLGSPVYYAGINGALKSFLDRAFFVAAANGGLFRHKAGAAVTAVRRAGSTTALEQLHKYFSISEMMIASGNYWSMIFGLTPGEAEQDAEGKQCLRILGQNLGWLLRMREQGLTSGEPPAEAKEMMNFIR